MDVVRADVGERRRRLDARRGHLDALDRHRLLHLPERVFPGARSERPRARAPPRSRAADPHSPSPSAFAFGCSPARVYSRGPRATLVATGASFNSLQRRCPSQPSSRATLLRSSPAGRGRWRTSTRTGWRSTSFRPPPRRSRPTGRSRSSTTAALPATTGWRPGSSASASRDAGISIEMQPLRWALRLVGEDASQSMAALCVTRAADGRWLAGRRAPWVASWAGPLGARRRRRGRRRREPRRDPRARAPGGVVGRPRAGSRRGAPAPAAPAGDVRRPGVARRGRRSRKSTPDHEHDEYAWWPSDIDEWPAEGETLATMARWLSS